MALELPTSLSPSKVSTFKDCALAFRFSAIDRLPEPPSEPAVKGTLVHRALELLLDARAHERTADFGAACLSAAMSEMRQDEEFVGLALDEAAEATFLSDADKMMARYFELEDPRTIRPIGLELRLETMVGDLRLRGIIDRLELDDQGGLVVTDYKTGRAPSEAQERSRLGGVRFYAYMCHQLFGVMPAKVQLMYLGSQPQFIITTPTEQSIRGLERTVTAVWTAVERACQNEDFRPNRSALCSWCAFQQWCPAWGGDPAAAPRPQLSTV